MRPVIFWAVNSLFKAHWGRARPVQIQAFGSTQQFTAPWVMTNQCMRNCSFTCRHAAAGFDLSISALVSHRRYWLPVGIVLGSLFGLVRIMNGAHFLSDVIFSYFVVMISAALFSWLIAFATERYIHKRQSTLRLG